MKRLGSIAELRSQNIESSALIPTMGALHQGHISLVRTAKELGLPVGVSIFVNPTQFGPNEDYAKYPRVIERDAHLLEEEGVDFLFSPTAQDIYPRASSTIVVPEVTEFYEGAKRPGHFEGVATIVCKLFQIVQPQVAFFGLKDLQQCVVIRRMVEDLNIPIQLRFEPTIREDDGLAMSSRNVYMSPSERAIAPALYRELLNTKDRLVSGEPVENVLVNAREILSSQGFSVDYYDLINLNKFAPTTKIDEKSAVVAALRLGPIRLIDNVLLFEGRNMP